MYTSLVVIQNERQSPIPKHHKDKDGQQAATFVYLFAFLFASRFAFLLLLVVTFLLLAVFGTRPLNIELGVARGDAPPHKHKDGEQKDT